MVLKTLSNLRPFVAGDDTRLREILHPKNDKLSLPYSLAFAKLDAGKSSLPHKLSQSHEVYYILQGKGRIHVNGVQKEVSKDDTIFVPADSIQQIENLGKVELQFLCIVSPPWSGEEEELIR